MSQGRGFNHPSDVLRDFYSLACVGKDRYYAGEYGPLCAALAEARSVLAAHPALAKAWSVPAVHPAWTDRVAPPEPRDDIWMQILSHDYHGSLSSMIARLMVHRREGPDGGLRRAAVESAQSSISLRRFSNRWLRRYAASTRSLLTCASAAGRRLTMERTIRPG